ncbi:MAG: FAD:protein FMN transferase [Candidatus Nealsonbacteria bacterium]|nr:FAD:protein FMN transferase [Candidatus Nealsonbacteria bacterium]
MSTNHAWVSYLDPPYALALCLALLCAASANAAAPPTTFTGDTMGTRYTIKVVDLPGDAARQTVEDEIRQELQQIDGLMSTYRPDSELSNFNRFDRTGEWFDVSPQTAAVLEEALTVGRLTDGAFDVTVGPLVNLWNFGPDVAVPQKVPTPEQIESAAARVGFENVEVRTDPPAVRKKLPGLTIDLSGVAKGFAVDRVAEYLAGRGAENFLVEIGGEVRAAGHNHRGVSWRIGVESPVVGIRAVEKTVALKNLAMATSGDYRNYFEADGVRYSHIIDPRTGRPVTHRLASVTVLDASCTRADALATALMVLGPQEGYELAVREKLAVLMIVRTVTGSNDDGFVEKTTPAFDKAVPPPPAPATGRTALTYLAAGVVFLLVFLAMAISVIRRKHCLGCSCKAADRIMRGDKPSDTDTCARDELIRLE